MSGWRVLTTLVDKPGHGKVRVLLESVAADEVICSAPIVGAQQFKDEFCVIRMSCADDVRSIIEVHGLEHVNFMFAPVEGAGSDDSVYVYSEPCYFNHHPETCVRNVCDAEGNATLVTTKRLHAGQEITTDYCAIYQFPQWFVELTRELGRKDVRSQAESMDWDN